MAPALSHKSQERESAGAGLEGRGAAQRRHTGTRAHSGGRTPRARPGAGRGGTRMAAASAHLPFLTPLTLDSAVDSSHQATQITVVTQLLDRTVWRL